MKNALATVLLPVALAAAVVAQDGASRDEESWRGPLTLGILVTDENGQGIPGAIVALRFSGDAASAGPPLVETDESGRAEVASLAVGEWQADVRRDGYMLYTAYLDLGAGKEPDVGFRTRQRTGTFWAPLEVRFYDAERRADLDLGERVRALSDEERSKEERRLARKEERRRKREEQPDVAVVVEEPPPQVAEAAAAEPPPRATAGETPSPPPSPPAGSESAAESDAEPRDAPPEAPSPPPPVAPPVAPRAAPADSPVPPPVERDRRPPPPSEPPPAVAPPAAEPRPASESPAEPPPAEPPPTTEPPAPRPRSQAAPREEPVTAEARAPEPPPAAVERPERESTPPAPPRAAESATEPPLRLPTIRANPNLLPSGPCPECRPGEWSLAAEGVAAPRPGDGTCEPDLAVRLEEASELVMEGLPRELRDFAGSLVDPAGDDVLRLLPAETGRRVAARLAPVTDAAGSCQAVGVVLPRGARFVGFRYQAADAVSGLGECPPAGDCQIGEARWIGNPVIERSDELTVVYAVFENRSGDRERRPRLVVYFTPRRGWAPPAR